MTSFHSSFPFQPMINLELFILLSEKEISMRQRPGARKPLENKWHICRRRKKKYSFPLSMYLWKAIYLIPGKQGSLTLMCLHHYLYEDYTEEIVIQEDNCICVCNRTNISPGKRITVSYLSPADVCVGDSRMLAWWIPFTCLFFFHHLINDGEEWAHRALHSH